MADPVAYFITITTYGTWLPGDDRGWVEYQNGFQMPNRKLEMESALRMSETAKVLSLFQRRIVEQQVRETCGYRKWVCHAVNCRTNHMHAVISAYNTAPTKVRADLKAWCTRRLSKEAKLDNANHWWAERGSIRWVLNNEELNQVIRYTLEEQDNK